MNELFLLLSLLLCSTTAVSQSWKLLDCSSDDCLENWKEKKFTRISTSYSAVKEEGHCVISASSRKSASGLWRQVSIKRVQSATISWRWAVDFSLSENQFERSKKGDDYAARLFVVFEPRFFNWKTRSICYVWASQQATGNVYRSPYAQNVGTFVLQSGNQYAHQWITEKRDVVADYKRFFGESPKEISAIAVMVDTDNTKSEASARFTDIVLSVP